MGEPFLFYLSQILAALAFAFGLIAFQFKTRSTVLRLWCCCAVSNGIHFFVLGRVESGSLAMITGTRFLVASKYTNKWLIPIFVSATCAMFYFTYSSPVSLIAFGASVLGCFGSFVKNQKILRFVFFICANAWMVHNFLVGSPVATLMEFAFITSNIVGWVRLYQAKNNSVEASL